MTTIAVLGALDTKGTEVEFLAERIQACGCNTLVVDIGVLGLPASNLMSLGTPLHKRPTNWSRNWLTPETAAGRSSP